MNTLKQAAQQALEALESSEGNINPERGFADNVEAEINEAITVLRAALAEPDYVVIDGEIFWGQDRLKFVERLRGWMTNDPEVKDTASKLIGKAADEIERLRAERDMTIDGFKSIVETEVSEIERLRASLAEPVQEPVAWLEQRTLTNGNGQPVFKEWVATTNPRTSDAPRKPLYTAPPQRKPLTEEEIRDLWSWAMTAEAERTATTQQHAFARAIERAHGIGGAE